MKGKWKNIVFVAVILAILAIPIVIDFMQSKVISVINYNKFADVVDSEEFALVYYGNSEGEGYTDIEQLLVDMKTEYEITVNTLDYEGMTDAQKEEIITYNANFTTSSGYAFIVDGEVKFVHNGDITQDKLKVLIDKYHLNIIPDSEIVYKTAKDASSFKKIVDSKNITMAVYGQTGCGWCDKFKPVINEVAEEYDIDIYYFDIAKFDSTEFGKIKNFGFKIPGTCTEDGQEQNFSAGFGTPLTLFTKNGKVIDCIGGYKDKEPLLSILKSVGMIK